MGQNASQHQIRGRCHCGAIEIHSNLSASPETFSLRQCDCSFCVRHGAAYLSDPKGSVVYRCKPGKTVHHYRQGTDGIADFLICDTCGVLVGVLFKDSEGKMYSAINGAIFSGQKFAEFVPVSPQALSKIEKMERWKKVWFAEVRIEQNFRPSAVKACEVPERSKPSSYPEPFRSRVKNRSKSQLGDVFGLKNFGVNMTRLFPGGESALFHKHTKQDEFIYILEGEPTLITEEGEQVLSPGMCAGFPAMGTAHQLVNRSKTDVVYLEVGDRTPNDEGIYPRDDLMAQMSATGWVFTKKDGTPYK